MSKLILQEFASLDGLYADRNKTTDFFQGKNGEGMGDDVDKFQGEFIKSIDLILMGRHTYETFADFWPDAKLKDSAAADGMNSIPKIVFSKSLDEVQWGNHGNITLVKDDAVEYTKALKATGDKTIIVWGSLSLARSFMLANLFDEIIICHIPIIIGKGYTLFPEDFEFVPAKLTHSREFDNGVRMNTYQLQPSSSSK